MTCRGPFIVSLVLVAMAFFCCSTDSTYSPTGSSDPTSTTGSSALGDRVQESNEFDCTLVHEVRVRFTEPGFIDHNRVGLFIKYIGLPPGRKLVDVWWDEENEPSKAQRIELGFGEVQRNDDNLFDIERVIEHRYETIAEKEPRRVRASVYVEGWSGDCSRVRHIVVGPVPLPAVPSKEADMELRGIGGDVGPGEVAIVWMDFVNEGPDHATDVTAVANMPPGFEIDSTTVMHFLTCRVEGSVSTGQTFVCEAKEMEHPCNSVPPTCAAVAHIWLRAPTLEGNYSINYRVRAREHDPNPSNNHVETTIAVHR